MLRMQQAERESGGMNDLGIGASGRGSNDVGTDAEPDSYVATNSEALAHSMLQLDLKTVRHILIDVDQDSRCENIARFRLHNGMTILHHACRMMQREWIEQVFSWSPDAVNLPSYANSKPCLWTPLQCLCDNALPDEEGTELAHVLAMVDLLVRAMTQEALENQTGTVLRRTGEKSGGLTAMHSLASRASGQVLLHMCEEVDKNIRPQDGRQDAQHTIR